MNSFFLSPTQDELYDHLDELDVMKVEKQVNEAMTWMNNKMNLQSKQSLSQDPVVKAQEIRVKTKVLQKSKPFKCFIIPNVLCIKILSGFKMILFTAFLLVVLYPLYANLILICHEQELYSSCNQIVTKPKPKVEPPKEEKTAEQNGPVNGQEGSEAQTASPEKGQAAPEKTEAKLPEMDID